MTPVWPASLPQKPRKGTWVGGARDDRVQFQPDVGPPILRRRTTAAVHIYSAIFPNLTDAGRASFNAFWDNDLAGGVRPFAWIDPVADDVALWTILGGDAAYSFTARGAGLHDLSLTLMRRPGTPWWAPDVLTDPLRLPYAVADYENLVFGVDGSPTDENAVALVAGTYDVYTTSDLGVVTVELAHVVVAGDIPATAPVGVAKIRAFVPA